jgi:hypothetical protein
LDEFLQDMREWIRNNPITKEDYAAMGSGSIPGPKHCEETKRDISESNKKYYQTPEGLERRKKMSNKNSLIKSEEMKKRWIDDYETLKERTKKGGRKKGSLDKGKRKRRDSIRLITDGKQTFRDAYEASRVYGVHPVNIRRKCRKMIDDWRYVNG